jgi:hypothetical protein
MPRGRDRRPNDDDRSAQQGEGSRLRLDDALKLAGLAPTGGAWPSA